MTKKGSLRNTAGGELAGLWRAFGFLLSVLLGLALGWRMFLSPVDSPTPTASSKAPARLLPIEPSRATAPTAGLALSNGIRPVEQMPSFTLPDLEGAPVDVTTFQGKVLLINFWTTWCPPCEAEMPALQRTYEAYSDQGFAALGVNWTEVDDASKVEPFVRRLGLTFPILLDKQGEVAEDLFNITGLPTSVLVGRDGVIRKTYIGPLQLDQLEGMILPLLEEAL